jgi:hypothetical protein
MAALFVVENKLTSLEGSPVKVTGEHFSENNLTSLLGFAQNILVVILL